MMQSRWKLSLQIREKVTTRSYTSVRGKWPTGKNNIGRKRVRSHRDHPPFLRSPHRPCRGDCEAARNQCLQQRLPAGSKVNAAVFSTAILVIALFKSVINREWKSVVEAASEARKCRTKTSLEMFLRSLAVAIESKRRGGKFLLFGHEHRRKNIRVQSTD